MLAEASEILGKRYPTASEVLTSCSPWLEPLNRAVTHLLEAYLIPYEKKRGNVRRRTLASGAAGERPCDTWARRIRARTGGQAAGIVGAFSGGTLHARLSL